MITSKTDQLLEVWMKSYFDELYRYAYARLSDAEVAKDILQETFIAAWKNQESFRKEAEERTWLYSILKNKIIDHYRKESRRQTVSFEDQVEERYFFDEGDHWRPQTLPHNWNDHPTDRKEFYRVLHSCKGKLTALYQMVFTLKYLDDCETDHICKVLQITTSNYWVILHRCKLHIRDCMEKHWLSKSK